MKVRLLVDTYYGKSLHKDEVIDVPKDVAKRWHKNHIATVKKSEIANLYEEDSEPVENIEEGEENGNISGLGNEDGLGDVSGEDE